MDHSLRTRVQGCLCQIIRGQPAAKDLVANVCAMHAVLCKSVCSSSLRYTNLSRYSRFANGEEHLHLLLAFCCCCEAAWVVRLPGYRFLGSISPPMGICRKNVIHPYQTIHRSHPATQFSHSSVSLLREKEVIKQLVASVGWTERLAASSLSAVVVVNGWCSEQKRTGKRHPKSTPCQ